MLSPLCKRRTGASLPWFSWQKAPRTAASTCSRLATPTQNLAIAAAPPSQYHEDYSQQKRRSADSHPATNLEWIDLGCRRATLRLDCFLISFRGEFLGHGFLESFCVHSVALGGVHENVVAAGDGSLIRRIQQADFE